MAAFLAWLPLAIALSSRAATFTLVAPADGATVNGSSANLRVAISPAPAESATISFHARAGVPAAGRDFTLAVLPDTQYYTASMNGGSPAIFQAQTDWIVANRTARNIVFATQLGDCVQNGDNNGNPVEWRAATNALYRLENPQTTLLTFGIPYGVAVGNHDSSPGNTAAGSTVFFNQYFGSAHFAGRDYYGGHYGTNNDNHYQFFSASGLDFLVVHLEYDPGANPAVLGWANNLLQAHPERRAIVVTHHLINAGNPGSFSAQGQAIYTALRTNANLFLMLGGHYTEEGRRQDTFNGRIVHSLLSDYQARANGGNGWMRLMEFSPSNNVIRVRTYSPTLDQFETDANSQFDLPCDMRIGPAFTQIASGGGAGYAGDYSATWQRIPADSRCEWFVQLDDDGVRSTSPVWSFTTASGTTEPPPSLTVNIQFDSAAGRVILTWPGTPGGVYRVVYRDRATDYGWADLSGDIPAGYPETAWSESISVGTPSRVYAVRVVR